MTSSPDYTAEETIQAYLALKWPYGLLCPLCGAQEWFTTPAGPHVVEGMPTSLDVGSDAWAPPVGVWLCVCQGCGFVAPLLEDFVSNAIKDVDIHNGAGI